MVLWTLKDKLKEHTLDLLANEAMKHQPKTEKLKMRFQ